ncbi:MAG: translation initiation factor [Ginsengibacter sp.]
MNKKKSSSSSPLVYSTDPFFIKQEHKRDTITLPASDQLLKISIDKKHRAGKIVTLISGFAGKDEDIEQLAKELKSFCGTGGSVKDGVIIIQGDNREKIFQRLYKGGYKQVKKI